MLKIFIETYKSVLIFFILITGVYSSDALPNYLVINNDTLEFRKAYIRINHIFRPFSRYKRKLIRQGNSSSACYIYKKRWKIKNDSLYLDTLLMCNRTLYRLNTNSIKEFGTAEISDSTIEKIKFLSDIQFPSLWKLNTQLKDYLTRSEHKVIEDDLYRFTSKTHGQRIPLEYDHLLKKQYRNKKIFADFYSGLFSVEVGELVDSMLVHYHTVSDSEIFYQIRDGIVQDTFSASALFINHTISVEKSINMGGFILPIFPQWTLSDSTTIDTLQSLVYRDELNAATIRYELSDIESDFDEQSRFSNVTKLVENTMVKDSTQFTYNQSTFLKLLYKGAVRHEWYIPYLNYVSGVSIDSSQFKKIAVLFTYNRKIIIEIECHNEKLLDKMFMDLLSNIDCQWIQREQNI